MITLTDKSRELTAGAIFSKVSLARTAVSHVQLPFQGTSVSCGGFDVLVAGLAGRRDGVISPVIPVYVPGIDVPASRTKAPLSGVPAWSPPVL